MYWGLTTGHGRHNRHFITILERRLLILEETNVFAVHVNVEETPQFAALVTESAQDTGITGFLGLQEAINAAGLHLGAGLIGGKFL